MKKPLVWGAMSWGIGYAAAVGFPFVTLPLYVPVATLVLIVLCRILSLPGIRWLSLLFLVLSAFAYYQWVDQRNVTAIRIEGEAHDLLNGSEVRLAGVIDSPVEVDGDHVSFIAYAKEVHLGSDTLLMVKENVSVSIRLLQYAEQIDALQWKRGDEVQLKGALISPSPARNFGGFDYRAYLRNQHIHWIVSLKGLDSVERSRALRYDWRQLLSWNDDFRLYLAGRLDLLFPEKQAGYMKGLLIGLRTDLEPEQFQQFSELGLTHVLAISGLQVAVFCAVVLWLLRKTGWTKERSLLVAMWLLPLFILFTGSSPSVVRAGLMGMAALYAVRKNMLKDALQIACLVGWGMLLWNPYYLLDVSFQLSFFVTVGLIVGVPWINKWLPLPYSRLKSSLSVTIVALVVSFPLTIYYFNQFSLLSLAANLILVPFISFVVTPLGSIALLFGLFSISVGSWAAWIVIQMNELTFWLSGWMDSWRMFHLIWPSPPLWWIAIYYVLAAAIVWSGVRLRRLQESRMEGVLINLKSSTTRSYKTVLYSAVFSAVLLLLYGYAPDFRLHEGRVDFLDVGQGDAILIQTPSHKNILIDGGGTIVFHKPGEEWKERKNPYEVGKKLLVPLLKKRGVHQLDYVISTHEDADHIGGLQAVLEQIPVKRILFNGTWKGTPGVTRFFQTAIHMHIPLLTPKAGTDLAVDPRTSLHVLHPAGQVDDTPTAIYIQNKQSLAFLLEMDDFRFVFTGDMEKTTEKEILQLEVVEPVGAAAKQPVDVLKVAHHGSKTSTTEEWLRYWQPKRAVISVGVHNIYGHPSEEVVERIIRHQAELYRTDEQGEIQMTVGKMGIRVHTRLHQHDEE